MRGRGGGECRGQTMGERRAERRGEADGQTEEIEGKMRRETIKMGSPRGGKDEERRMENKGNADVFFHPTIFSKNSRIMRTVASYSVAFLSSLFLFWELERKRTN